MTNADRLRWMKRTRDWCYCWLALCAVAVVLINYLVENVDWRMGLEFAFGIVAAYRGALLIAATHEVAFLEGRRQRSTHAHQPR